MSERGGGPAVWIATCGGLGYFPMAPGTVGSAIAVVITAAVTAVPQAGPWLRVILIVAAAVILWMGVWAARQAELFFGKTDPNQVVIDEVAGQFVTLAAVPNFSWTWLAAGFLLFRVLDILKPFPARRAEGLSGGWGIMIDDLIAGAYAAALIIATGKLFG